MPSSLGLCRPGGLGAFTWSLASGLDSWTPESELAEGLELVMGLLTVCLCPRPHVCAEQELTLVGRRQPCVRAFSRTVPVWRPGCGRQAWCVSHERRYVQGSRGPMWGSGFGSPPELHGVQGGGSVAGAGLSWSQGTGPPHPTSALAPQLSGLWASLLQDFVLGSCDQLFRKRALRGQHVGLPKLTGFLCFCFWP